MKKYLFCIILTLGLVLSSCGGFSYTHSDDIPVSCNIKGEADISYSDGGIFFYDGAKLRFDVRSGKISTAGEDNEGRYDGNPYPESWSVENLSYSYEYACDDSREDARKVLVRRDTVTGETVRYNENGELSDKMLWRPCFVSDGRIYFTDGTEIFSTDTELSDKQTVASGVFAYDVLSNGEYIYYGVQTEANLEEIYRMSLDGGEGVSIGIFCRPGGLFISESYLYYKSYEPIEFSEGVALEGEHIYRASHDGSGVQTVYSFASDMRTRSECYVGNYIYALFERIDENGHYMSFDEGRYEIVRIDMTTGEMLIINEEETRAETTDE